VPACHAVFGFGGGGWRAGNTLPSSKLIQMAAEVEFFISLCSLPWKRYYIFLNI
jgi:hypothetical protein